MRIAFLNPFRGFAEHQAFGSLQIAAGRIGHELIHCGNSEDVDACSPEFVLVAVCMQAKLNDVPHYGVIHAPREAFFTSRVHFRNLLTYDGVLTISDSLERFLRDVSVALDRPTEIGFYYNTCQRQELSANLCSLIENRRLVITYFGTNWDQRRTRFFKLLSDLDMVQICGPASAWVDINPRSYGGSPDFDGNSVQTRYAANGIGLCLLGDQHLQDDVISNRIFEIASVGAIAICCDIPWIRKHFGDTVYYVNQRVPDAILVNSVMQRVSEIYSNPEGAIAKARAARQIFEERFAAEILLDNAVKYHEAARNRRRTSIARAKAIYEPVISVIIRCGRPLPSIGRALQAIARQTYGKFEVILVRYRDLDLQPLLDLEWPNIRAIKVVDAEPGARSASLWAGLSVVTGEYFAILDDDDWLFSTHYEELFRPFPSEPQKRFLAYSGAISEHMEPQPMIGGGTDRRELFRFGIDTQDGPGIGVSGAFASNSFVASTDLLHASLLQDPGMFTGEDSFLILSLLAQAEPRFSFASTSVHERGRDGQSDFKDHPRRFEDLLTLSTRLFARRLPPSVDADGWPQLREFWSTYRQEGPGRVQQLADRLVYRSPGNWTSSLEPDQRELVSSGFDIKGSKVPKRAAVDARTGAVHISCREEAWAYGAVLRVKGPDAVTSECLIVVELKVEQGEIGIGLLNRDESGFVFRLPLKRDPRLHEVHIAVSDFTKMGRLVVQNWQNPQKSIVSVLSIKIYV